MNNCGEGKWNTCKEAKWDNQLNTELSKLKSQLYTLELKFKNLGLSDLKEFDSCLNPQAGDTIQFNGRTFNSKPNILGINSLVSEGIPIAEVITGSGEIQTIYSPSNIKIAEDDSSPGDSLVNLRLLKQYIENLNTIIHNLKDRIGEPEGNQTIIQIIEQLQREIEQLKQNDCCATLENSITRLTDRVTALEGNNCCATLTDLIGQLTRKVTALENDTCCETLGERLDQLEEQIGGGNTKFYTITNEIPNSRVNMKYIPEGETANILVTITGQYVDSNDVIFEYGDNTIQYSQQHNIVDTISYEISNVSNDIVIKLKENSERVNPYFVTYSITQDQGDDIKAAFYTPKVELKPGETFTGYLTVDQDYTYTVRVVNSTTNEPVQFNLTQGGVVTVNDVQCNLFCDITLTKRSSDVVIVDEVAEVINRINNSTANHTRLLIGESYEIVVTLNTGYGLSSAATINITHGSTTVTNYNTKTVTSNGQQYIKQISFTINDVQEDVTIEASGGEVVSEIVETTRNIERSLTGVKLYGPYENPLQTIMNVEDTYEAMISLDDPEGQITDRIVKIGSTWIDQDSSNMNTIKVSPHPELEGDLEITVEAESTPKATLITTIPRTYIYQDYHNSNGDYIKTRRVETNSSPLESIYFESNSGYNSNPGIELSSLYNGETGVIKITYETASYGIVSETIAATPTPYIDEETSETSYYVWTTNTENLPFEIHIHTKKDLENNDSEYVSEFSIYFKDVESIEKDSTVTLSLADNISEDDVNNIITNYTQDTNIYVYAAVQSEKENGVFKELEIYPDITSESYMDLKNRSESESAQYPYVKREFSWGNKQQDDTVYPVLNGQFVNALGAKDDVKNLLGGTILTVDVTNKYGIVYIQAYDGTGNNIDTCEVTINANGEPCKYFGNYISRDENTNTFTILRNADCAITVMPTNTDKVLYKATDTNNRDYYSYSEYQSFKDSNMSTIKLHKTETTDNLSLTLTFKDKSS